MIALRANPQSGFNRVVGIGGIGSGIVFALEGNHTLGRNESRLGKLIDARDYCKLHIVEHYIARLMGASPGGTPFHVAAIGLVGDDDVGRRMVREMEEAGIDARLVRTDPSHRTLFSVCFVYPDSCGGNITTSNSAAAALSVDDVQLGASLLQDSGRRGIAVALPEVPMDVRREFLRIATGCGSYRAASFASADIAEARESGMLAQIDLLAMNKEEAGALVKSHPPLNGKGAAPAVSGNSAVSPDRESDIATLLKECARVLTAKQPNIRIVVSAGADGAYAYDGGTWDFCPAPKVAVISTAGAGDALLAGMLCGIAAGVPFIVHGQEFPTLASRTLGTSAFSERRLKSALDFGVLLAAYTVQSPHTIHPEASVETLLAFASSLKASFGGELAAALEAQRVAAR